MGQKKSWGGAAVPLPPPPSCVPESGLVVVECILLVYCITLYCIVLIYGLEWAGGGGVYPAGVM